MPEKNRQWLKTRYWKRGRRVDTDANGSDQAMATAQQPLGEGTPGSVSPGLISPPVDPPLVSLLAILQGEGSPVVSQTPIESMVHPQWS